jgi:hypothetical protein
VNTKPMAGHRSMAAVCKFGSQRQQKRICSRWPNGKFQSSAAIQMSGMWK